MQDVMTTTQLPPAERFDAFRTAISTTFVPLDAISDEPGFYGRLRSAEVGAVQLSQVTAKAHVVRRTERLIRASDPEYYKVGLQVAGYGVLTQDGREAALTPGDFAIYDTSRPYQLSFGADFRMLVAMFPRERLRVPEDCMRALTARRVSGKQGLGALTSPFMLGLGDRLEGLTEAVGSRLSEALLDLLAASFADQPDCAAGISLQPRLNTLRMRIHAFIEERLNDPDLDPGTIARAHNISVRYLYKLFEADGSTVSGWIRAHRLEHCRLDLQDPRFAGVPVAVIGARWGLIDAAGFSRAFKAKFGVGPRDFRRGCAD